jgi:hypothetical protein
MVSALRAVPPALMIALGIFAGLALLAGLIWGCRSLSSWRSWR